MGVKLSLLGFIITAVLGYGAYKLAEYSWIILNTVLANLTAIDIIKGWLALIASAVLVILTVLAFIASMLILKDD